MSDSGRTLRQYCNMCECCHDGTYDEIVKCRKKVYDEMKSVRCELNTLKGSKVPLSPLDDDDPSEWGEDRTGND